MWVSGDERRRDVEEEQGEWGWLVAGRLHTLRLTQKKWAEILGNLSIFSLKL